jgi:hypothetical protein
MTPLSHIRLPRNSEKSEADHESLILTRTQNRPPSSFHSLIAGDTPQRRPLFARIPPLVYLGRISRRDGLDDTAYDAGVPVDLRYTGTGIFGGHSFFFTAR